MNARSSGPHSPRVSVIQSPKPKRYHLLRKLQIDMMSPRTALEQVPIRARLFHHLRMYSISPCVLVLPVVVVRHGSCEEWLFASVSFRAGIGGRGAGEFVESEGER